jgi:hypothetical protein
MCMFALLAASAAAKPVPVPFDDAEYSAAYQALIKRANKVYIGFRVVEGSAVIPQKAVLYTDKNGNSKKAFCGGAFVEDGDPRDPPIGLTFRILVSPDPDPLEGGYHPKAKAYDPFKKRCVKGTRFTVFG